MAIFVNVWDTTIIVSGDTFPINPILGRAGLGFKFSKQTKRWEGPCSLKAITLLSEQSGAILTSAASDMKAQFELAAKKRAAYMAAKKR